MTALTVHRMLNSTRCACIRRIAATTLSKVGFPPLSLRLDVQMPGTVQADADQEPVFAQEFAPLVVDQHPVGLEGVFQDGLAADVSSRPPRPAGRKSNPISVGSPPCQAMVLWLASAAGGHSSPSSRPTCGSGCPDTTGPSSGETVVAGQIAGRAGRLRHHVEDGRGARGGGRGRTEGLS